MYLKKPEFIDNYLKFVRKRLEKELPEAGFEIDMFKEATNIIRRADKTEVDSVVKN